MVELLSELTATPIQHVGSDEMIAKAALVSTGGEVKEDKISGLIRYLYTNRHTSPFEHTQVTFHIDAPLFVLAQWSRHRTQSLNVKSLRFGEAEDRYYLPSHDRPLVNTGSGAYPRLVQGEDHNERIALTDAFSQQSLGSWQAYQNMLESGVAEEIARGVLPTNLYTQWYATTDLWNWMGFLNKRIESQKNRPQWEIQELALQIENYLHDLFPISMKYWREDFDAQR